MGVSVSGQYMGRTMYNSSVFGAEHVDDVCALVRDDLYSGENQGEQPSKAKPSILMDRQAGFRMPVVRHHLMADWLTVDPQATAPQATPPALQVRVAHSETIKIKNGL
ncbi:hypothetical protein G6M04_30215 [Agrobacterium rhizogenes]|uniref:hypothetical protein n=1 Tax=Rhizobium rhizogenes TaxID=359 RepID=UPI001571750E|nr:hypothetical protein [Rhizobium rhizogenes]NTG51675.1 hypothetical protein [Rhizobium rhizogenes]